MSIKFILKNKIQNALNNMSINYNEINIERPKDKKNGDYSTTIALSLSKQLHKKPIDIAEDIISNMDLSSIATAKAVLPGFINFNINHEFLLDNINNILKEESNYGRNNYGNSKKINIEFVSANPTGNLHIGHARGATYGDNLARIMTFSGFDVTKEYYINDAGNQMNNLGISIKERYKEICNIPFQIPEDGYHGKEIIEIASSIYKKNGNSKIAEEIEYFKTEGLNILLDQIKKVLDSYRVNFDVFTSEKALYNNLLVDNTLSKLQKSGKCYVNEGALWLKTTDYSDEKDRVLIKSDGSYTYLLPDIAYHSNKFDRKFDKLIDVLGSDHHGYINRLKSSLKFLDYPSENLEIKILQMVRLIKDGEEIKMSKRTGKTLTMTELINEIGVNATRYFFSSKSPDTQMDFNISLAGKQDSDNPVYYIEYANSRITSIINNYSNEIKLPNKYLTLSNDITYTILNKLYDFEDIVISAAIKETPHIIANYVYDLASLFHSYYASEKIIDESNKRYTEERILFIKAIKIVLNNALNLLGILPREKM